MGRVGYQLALLGLGGHLSSRFSKLLKCVRIAERQTGREAEADRQNIHIYTHMHTESKREKETTLFKAAWASASASFWN